MAYLNLCTLWQTNKIQKYLIQVENRVIKKLEHKKLRMFNKYYKTIKILKIHINYIIKIKICKMGTNFKMRL